MKAKLIKTGDQYLLRDLKGEVLGITIGETNGNLSLKNCQAIERGYDLDDLANEYNPVQKLDVEFIRAGFKKGFQKALEILSDKKFTEEDIHAAFGQGWERSKAQKNGAEFYDEKSRFIKSLQQNEWEVEVEMMLAPKYYGYVPKLDADGKLILKRVI